MADAIVKTAIVAETGNIRQEMEALRAMYRKLEAQGAALEKENQRLSASLDRAGSSAKGAKDSHGGLLGSWGDLVKQGAALAASYMTLEAGLAVLKGAISSTQATADAFDVVMAEAQAGVEHFYTTLATGDWSNFFDGLVEATAKAKGLQEQLDKLADVKGSHAWRKAGLERQMSEARVILKDPSSYSAEQRKQAKQMLISGSQELAESARVSAEEQLVAQLKFFEAKSGAIKPVVPKYRYSSGSSSIIAGQYGAVYGSREGYAPNVEAEMILKRYRPVDLTKEGEGLLDWVMTKGRAGMDKAQTDYEAKLADLEAQARTDKAAGVRLAKLIVNDPRRYQLAKALNNFTDAERDELLGMQNVRQSTLKEAFDYQYKANKIAKGVDEDGSISKRATRTPKSEPIYPEGSIAKAEQDLQKLSKALNTATTDEARAVLEGKIRQLQALIAEMRDTAESVYLGAEHRRKQQDINTAISTVPYKQSVQLSPYKPMSRKDLSEGIGNTISREDHKRAKRIEAETRAYQGQQETIANLSDTFRSLAGATDEATASVLSWGANLLSTIASALPQIVALTTAQGAEASAAYGATVAKSASAASIAGPIAAIAAIASVVAAIAAVPKFATGGVVGGSSYYGDKILARVNSGELILNETQQRRLLGQIEAGRTESLQRISIGITPSVKIKGQDLYLSMRRTERSNNRH